MFLAQYLQIKVQIKLSFRKKINQRSNQLIFFLKCRLAVEISQKDETCLQIIFFSDHNTNKLKNTKIVIVFFAAFKRLKDAQIGQKIP